MLGAVAAVAATAVLGGRLLGSAAGLAAGAALLGSILFVAFARYVRPETLFVAALQWGLTGLLVGGLSKGAGGFAKRADGFAKRAEGERSAPKNALENTLNQEATSETTAAPYRHLYRAARAWHLIAGAALGLAALAKDPLGLVAPLAVVALAGAGVRPRPPRRWWSPGAIVVALVVGLGWYVFAALASPGFVWYTVVDNHLLNAARARRFPDEDVPLSSLEFLAVSGLGAFPWVFGAAASVAALVQRRAWRDPAETPWVALALWATGVLAVFALSPFKLPHYGLPAYPAIALLAVRWWMAPGRGRPGIAVHAAAFAALAVLCGGAAAGDGRLFSDTVLSATDVATRKEEAAGAAGAPAIAWADLQPMLARFAIVFGAGAAGLALATARRSPRLGLAVTLATMLACVPAVSAGLAHVASGRSVRELALAVSREAGPGTLVLHEGPIEQSGALEFYSGRRPILVDGTRSVLGFGASFADASEQFWDRTRLEREWVSGRPMLLVTPRAPARSVVGSLPADRVRLVLEDNGRRLYASRAPAPRRRLRRRRARAGEARAPGAGGCDDAGRGRAKPGRPRLMLRPRRPVEYG